MNKRVFDNNIPVVLVKIFVSVAFFIVAVLLLSLNNYSDRKLILFFRNLGGIASIWFFDYMFRTFHREEDHGKPPNYYIKGILSYYSLYCVCVVVEQALYV